jgi:hypothetical protein
MHTAFSSAALIVTEIGLRASLHRSRSGWRKNSLLLTWDILTHIHQHLKRTTMVYKIHTHIPHLFSIYINNPPSAMLTPKARFKSHDVNYPWNSCGVAQLKTFGRSPLQTNANFKCAQRNYTWPEEERGLNTQTMNFWTCRSKPHVPSPNHLCRTSVLNPTYFDIP